MIFIHDRFLDHKVLPLFYTVNFIKFSSQLDTQAEPAGASISYKLYLEKSTSYLPIDVALLVVLGYFLLKIDSEAYVSFLIHLTRQGIVDSSIFHV